MSIRKLSAAAKRVRSSVSKGSTIEAMESRQLLSAVLSDTIVQINTPASGAYTPAQVRTAYGVSALGLPNEGQGITIGIVDEFNDANITADVNAFSSYYSLPKLDGVAGDPTMTVYQDTALGSVTTAAGTGVGAETSLDVEWAHAMAPMANILLVEVPGSGSTYAALFNELLHGVQVAAQKGAQSISLSYGIGESSIGSSSAISENSTYLSTGAAASVAVSVATGDDSSPIFPATSPNVIAVGGTSLYFGSVKGTYSFETAWGGIAGAGAGGGGTSSSFATPAFQSNNGVNFGDRAIPDVSLVADPITAVSIYDSLDSSSSPWTSTGGTSVASPIFAGIVALAQQERASASLAPLSSVQIDQDMYSMYNSASYSTYFHDVNQGSNKDVSSGGKTLVTGYSATTGYDLATGLGSPIANTLVPALSILTPSATAGLPSSPIRRLTIGGAFSGVVSIVPIPADPDSDPTSIFDLSVSALPVISTPNLGNALSGLPALLPIPASESGDQTGADTAATDGIASPIGDPVTPVISAV